MQDNIVTLVFFYIVVNMKTVVHVNHVIELQQNFVGDFFIGKFRNRLVGGLDYTRQYTDKTLSTLYFDTIKAQGTIPTYNNFNKKNLDAMYVSRGANWVFPTNETSNTYSAYAADVFNVTDNLMLSAALRLDHFVYEGKFDATTGAVIPGTPYHQTVLSPKFGIVYQPVKDKVSLFGNYQNSFNNKAGVDYKNTPFKPEHANQVEGGVKLDILGGKLSSTISYYYIEVSNMIHYVTIDGNPWAQIQNGTQASKGIEAEVTANPISGLNIVAGITYNDSKYTKADTKTEGRRPETAGSPYNAHWWINYRLPAGIVKGLGVGFGGNYASDNMVVNKAEGVGQFTLPAYTVLGATIFYDLAKFRVSLKADNLTNQHYWIGFNNTVNPQKLRSIAASLTFRF